MKNKKWLLWTVLMAVAVTAYAQQYNADDTKAARYQHWGLCFWGLLQPYQRNVSRHN